MANVLGEFCECVENNAFYELPNFALGFRGPDCHFVRAVQEIQRAQTNGNLMSRFIGALDKLDLAIAADNFSCRQGDATIANRWLALSSLVRSQLPAQHDEQALVRQAKIQFDRFWDTAVAHSSTRSEPDPPATLLTPPVGEKMYPRFSAALTPWTMGSWMAWDVLSEMSNVATPRVVEKANVLFGSDEGDIAKLVVCVLDGPAELVTPNLWRLGLTAFTTTVDEKSFLCAVERVMSQAARRNCAKRICWQLESPDTAFWQGELNGRSVEAAAAVAVLAAFESLEEINQHADNERSPEAILDAQAAVTAGIGQGTVPFSDWPLVPVERTTLGVKFDAAKRHGIDLIAVAADQPMDGVVFPSGLRVERARTVREAFDIVRAVNQALDRYAEYVRSSIVFQEAETPVAEWGRP